MVNIIVTILKTNLNCPNINYRRINDNAMTHESDIILFDFYRSWMDKKLISRNTRIPVYFSNYWKLV